MANKSSKKSPYSIYHQNRSLKDLKFIFSLVIFFVVIKFVIFVTLNDHFFYGADAEGYINGVQGLIDSGFFSKTETLGYWPAGYPILIWLMPGNTAYFKIACFTILQTLIFAYATFRLGRVLIAKNLNKSAKHLVFLININPTLGISTLVIGYEALAASLMILSLTFYLDFQSQIDNIKFKLIFAQGLCLAICVFLQPRFLLISFFILALIILKIPKTKQKFFSAITLILLIVLPLLTLTFRNQIASGYASVSTNLGSTLIIGIGKETYGNYVPGYPGIPCDITNLDKVEADKKQIGCTINWYKEHPGQIIRLTLFKSIFFWSPWTGWLSTGSMARNPWRQFNPVERLSQVDEGFKSIAFGPVGASISIIWLLTYLSLILLGVKLLFSKKIFSRSATSIILLNVLCAMLISIFTLGDNRQRLPIMPFILIIQYYGYVYLRNKLSKKSSIG